MDAQRVRGKKVKHAKRSKALRLWEKQDDDFYGPVAQLDRVADFESAGRGFEPLLARFPGTLKIKGFRGFSYAQFFRGESVKHMKSMPCLPAGGVKRGSEIRLSGTGKKQRPR